MESYFSTLPLEVTLDLLSLLDKRSVTQFASVSKNQKNYFDKQDGLWKQIVCRLFHWGTKDLNKVQGSGFDWKKEYRVSAYYNDKVLNNQMYADPSQTQFKWFSVLDETNRCYKYDEADEVEELLFFYFNIQSKLPLYPLPIGNFSVAYYETEILDDCSKIGYIYVGGALDGFVNGLPGVGRNSFGYGANGGRIVLENDFGISIAPSCTTGDIMGFGIDFSSHSVFFTKNGKVVAEATKSTLENPIFNLKTLHATIGFAGFRECKVNLGSAPFEFDILRYQQEKSKTKLYSAATRLYSDVLREHLTAFSESETFNLIETLHHSYSPMDYNLPPPEAQINPFLYMTLYTRVPPNFVPPSDVANENTMASAVKALAYCRAISNALPMLFKIENDENARQAFDYIAECLEVKRDDNYEDYINNVAHKAILGQCEIFRLLIAISVDELLKDYSRFYAHLLFSFVLLGNFDHQHYLSQVAALAFHKAVNPFTPHKRLTQQQVQDAINISPYKILGVRRTSILLVAGEKIKYRIKPQKEKDRIEALRVYGNDKILGSLFDVCFKQMAKVSSMIPTAYDDDILTVLAEAKAGTMDRALTYGIFAFQLSPEQYTESEMTNEVLRRLNALATDEVKRDYLKKSLENWESTPPEVLDTIAAVVQKIFGYTLEKAGSPEAMVNALKAFMKEKLKKIERKIKRKKLAQAAAQSKKSTTLVIGASVAVATIALVSALLFMRRQSK